MAETQNVCKHCQAKIFRGHGSWQTVEGYLVCHMNKSAYSQGHEPVAEPASTVEPQLEPCEDCAWHGCEGSPGGCGCKCHKRAARPSEPSAQPTSNSEFAETGRLFKPSACDWPFEGCCTQKEACIQANRCLKNLPGALECDCGAGPHLKSCSLGLVESAPQTSAEPTPEKAYCVDCWNLHQPAFCPNIAAPQASPKGVAEQSAEPQPAHVCGLMGYGVVETDFCPACEWSRKRAEIIAAPQPVAACTGISACTQKEACLKVNRCLKNLPQPVAGEGPQWIMKPCPKEFAAIMSSPADWLITRTDGNSRHTLYFSNDELAKLCQGHLQVIPLERLKELREAPEGTPKLEEIARQIIEAADNAKTAYIWSDAHVLTPQGEQGAAIKAAVDILRPFITPAFSPESVPGCPDCGKPLVPMFACSDSANCCTAWNIDDPRITNVPRPIEPEPTPVSKTEINTFAEHLASGIDGFNNFSGKARIIDWIRGQADSWKATPASTGEANGWISVNKYTMIFALSPDFGSVALLLKPTTHHNPLFRGKWTVPGGLLEVGEAEIDGAVREFEEETQLAVASRDFRFVMRFLCNCDPTEAEHEVSVYGITLPIEQLNLAKGSSIEPVSIFSEIPDNSVWYMKHMLPIVVDRMKQPLPPAPTSVPQRSERSRNEPSGQVGRVS